MRQVAEIAKQHQANSVTAIKLSIGPLSGIEPELLMQAFPIASAGTIAENAALTIEQLPVRVRCQSCGSEAEASTNKLFCSECGDWQTQLLSGDQMLLESVELKKNAALTD